MASDLLSFKVGDTFANYKDVESKIEQYQREHSVQLYKRSSRSIAATKQRAPNRIINDALKFSEVEFSCIHGGQKFKTKGDGIRNQSTFRMGCKASIKLRTTSDGQHLQVRSLNEIHNHEINRTVFRNLFQQRRLETTDKENVANLLGVKANIKMIQQKVMSKTGKVVLLKDIHNMKHSSSSSENHDLTALQSAVDHLSKKQGTFVKIISNDNNEMRGLFFQDSRMRSTFDAYPEFLCIDATYKVNDLRMPLYVLLVENGNGQSEIVGMWLVAEETESMITEMVTLFKEQNAKWSDVQTVMSDKDFVEREVFKKQFPAANLKICLFHVLRTFRREITAEKMGVNKVQRDNLLEILQKISYSKTIEEYNTYKDLLIESQHDLAIQYFNQQWDTIRDQWVVGLSMECSLGNKTNNRLESINQKIKQVVDKNCKIDSFASDIIVFLDAHRTEIDGKMCKASTKVPVTTTAVSTTEVEYRQKLTPYAYSLIQRELVFHIGYRYTNCGKNNPWECVFISEHSTKLVL